MTAHEPHIHTHGAASSPTDAAAAEKAVADAIEDAIGVPASIEEQALLDAAEIEEIEAS